MPVDVIAPGDMRVLGGRNSQGTEKKMETQAETGQLDEPSGRKVSLREIQGLRSNQTSLPTVSHSGQIKLQCRANATEITHR